MLSKRFRRLHQFPLGETPSLTALPGSYRVLSPLGLLAQRPIETIVVKLLPLFVNIGMRPDCDAGLAA
jgi:hypothetical protein